MAIAGRVAIVPKGEWSQSVTYDKLDLVMFNNDAYVAKKASTGIEPTNDEYWMLILNNVVAEDLENILNGTTPVGNALKVNGLHAYEIQAFEPISGTPFSDIKARVDWVNTYMALTAKGNDGTTYKTAVDNADTVDGLHASDFAKQVVNSGITTVLAHGDHNYLANIYGLPTIPTVANYILIIGKDGNNRIVSVLALSENSNHVYKYALTTGAWTQLIDSTGGTIANAITTPLEINNTSESDVAVALSMLLRGSHQGNIGFNNGVPAVYTPTTGWQNILHTGNSQKVVTSASAPSDTSALWVDTTNKKVKAYIDGAWTAMA